MQFALKYVEDLSDDALKDKEVGCIFDLLKTIKTLLRRCSVVETNVDSLRLSTTLRMFKIAHYNAKMNALKEVWSRCLRWSAISSLPLSDQRTSGCEADGGAILSSQGRSQEPHPSGKSSALAD